MKLYFYTIIFVQVIFASANQENDKPSSKLEAKMQNVERQCDDQANVVLPPTATDTTQRLIDLRNEMQGKDYAAYIIPYSDAHLSEYVAPGEKRRAWISGFTGSAGTAVVTMQKAALWTDGRYFLQADQQLDCNWILMKTGEMDVPSMEEWLAAELKAGESVAASPFLFSISYWQSMEVELKKDGILMVQSIPDLIDLIWVDRPPATGTSVVIFPVEYAGKLWTDKLKDARAAMVENNVDYLLLTVLDEIAWFFNLRGNDIPYTPVFTAYAIVPKSSNVMLFANTSLFNFDEMTNHLNESECDGKTSCVLVLPYDEARNTLQSLANVSMSSEFWLAADGTNYGMYSAVNPDQQFSEYSPLKVAKAVKNGVEVKAMRQAHIYDAVALCEYIQWLEVNVPLGKVDELKGEEYLKNLRLAQAASKGLSFGSISASGPNGAIIHYGSSEETNRNLTTNEIYLIDSGGQYFEGTTDVTRTMHFGKPTDFQIEAFTRVLMGAIDLESAIFPYTKNGNDLDVLARRHLYDVGLEFRHGTGHGVGQYLCIHEYPPGISNAAGGEFALQPGMITSIEPGYYEDGEFGIRHENLNVVVEANTEHNFGGYEFYTFDPITLVPYQKKMIDISLLSNKQLEYINNYHAKVLKHVGDEALNQNKPELKDWLEKVTSPIERSVGTQLKSNIFYTFLALVFHLFLWK